MRWIALVAILGAAAGVTACGTAMSESGDASDLESPQPLESPIVEDLEAGRSGGAATFDHGTFDDLLSEHVDQESGTVDYSGLSENRGQLETYLDRIAGVDLAELPGDEQLALLINAYNGYTLQLVLDNYPGIDSIQDLSEPWSRERYTVGGYDLSLDQIEHRLIRPIYRDPRIHFAVNCAAVDCPYLAESAYTGENLDEQLEARAEAILTDEQFVRVEDETLGYSRVMEWYKVDFVDSSFDGSADSVPGYIARYADDEVGAFIEQHGGDPPTAPLEYDWSLNDSNRVE